MRQFSGLSFLSHYPPPQKGEDRDSVSPSHMRHGETDLKTLVEEGNVIEVFYGIYKLKVARASCVVKSLLWSES